MNYVKTFEGFMDFFKSKKQEDSIKKEPAEETLIEEPVVEEEPVEEEPVVEEEEKYFINFYIDENGEKVRGNWKLTEEETDIERNSHLYKNRLGLRWKHTASISRSEVDRIAKEHDMSIGDVLNHV